MVLWRRIAEEAINGWPRRMRLSTGTMVAMEGERERGERVTLLEMRKERVRDGKQGVHQ